MIKIIVDDGKCTVSWGEGGTVRDAIREAADGACVSLEIKVNGSEAGVRTYEGDADALLSAIKENKLLAREPAAKRIIELIKGVTTYVPAPYPVQEWHDARKELPEEGVPVEVQLEDGAVFTAKIVDREILPEWRYRYDASDDWDSFGMWYEHDGTGLYKINPIVRWRELPKKEG